MKFTDAGTLRMDSIDRIMRISMNTEIIFQVLESPEGGYEARALGYSIFTESETVEGLRAMVRDAVECHFQPETRPPVIRLHFVRDEVLTT
jgi:hypothetical protein